MTGKEVAGALIGSLQERVSSLTAQGVQPSLVIVRAGENPGDLSYEKGAVKRCGMAGVKCRCITVDEQAATEELVSLMETLNRDDSVHGVLLLRPLPVHIDQAAVEQSLIPAKDVDCMTDTSLSALFAGKKGAFAPCTAEACMEILDYYGIDVTGLQAVVVGRSMVIGRPVAMMLLQRNATVTICHTRTRNLPALTRQADLIVAAAGRAGMIGGEYLSEGQIVIDVGINTDDQGKLCGDVRFEDAGGAACITPVPGGVGSVTTSVLVRHVIEAAEAAAGKNQKNFNTVLR